MGSIFTLERERDQSAVIHDLEERIEQLESALAIEKNARLEAQANVARMKRNANKPLMIPSGDVDEGYECTTLGCYAPLEEWFVHCPGCGCEIDWRTSVEPQSMYDTMREYEIDMLGEPPCS